MNSHISKTPLSERCDDTLKYTQWTQINWKSVYRTVNRLQTRIAKAAEIGNWNLVKRLQYLLTHSFHAKLLAVKAVTRNRGSRTPGVDGIIWLNGADKLSAAYCLTDKHYKAMPLKRKLIPKPGKSQKRPLSIPTMHDRAMQKLYALALQPVAEVTSDLRSFGFRLFRSTHDACQYTFLCLRHPKSAEWILEGDIKGCFDNISHSWILKNIPMDKSIVKQFLNAGFISEGVFHPTLLGTPQGGQISPILANMTLDGMEDLIYSKFTMAKVHFIRYADDFLVTAPTRDVAEAIKTEINGFLEIRGLKLSEEKTIITHINEGFKFLGWTFQKFSGVLLIKPSNESLTRVTSRIREIFHRAKAWSQDKLIEELNPIIEGFTNYNKHVVSKDAFRKMDYILWRMLQKWAYRRHSNKGRKWVGKKYWHSEGERSWVFKTKGNKLTLFADTKIKRYRMVKLDQNPYLDKKYFYNRRNKGKQPESDIQIKLPSFAAAR